MKPWLKKFLLILLAVVAILSRGFFLGRRTVKKEVVTDIQYIKGDSIVKTIYLPIPVKETPPPDTANIIRECVRRGLFTELFPPRKRDTIIITKKDTSSLITDWATERFYNKTLFDNDSVGTFIFNANVQYNRMQSFSYKYTPITKTVTIKEQYIKKFSPFVGAGMMDGPAFAATAGAFFNEKWGISLLYTRNPELRSNDFGIMAMYKF